MKARVFCSCGFPHNRGFQPLVRTQPDQYFIKRASVHVGSVTCRTREARWSPSIGFWMRNLRSRTIKPLLGFYEQSLKYLSCPKHARHGQANHHNMDKNLQLTQNYIGKRHQCSVSVVKIIEHSLEHGLLFVRVYLWILKQFVTFGRVVKEKSVPQTSQIALNILT